jgi:hypothetical protein
MEFGQVPVKRAVNSVTAPGIQAGAALMKNEDPI